jgi:hypothetical protein
MPHQMAFCTPSWMEANKYGALQSYTLEIVYPWPFAAIIN